MTRNHVQVTLTYGTPSFSGIDLSGKVHYRMHSRTEDYSGWADDEEAALRAVRRLMKS